MKFVIFADKSYNYVRPIADGLSNKLINLGHESLILYNGLYWLHRLNLLSVLLADIVRFFKNLVGSSNHLYIYRFWVLLTFNNKKFRQSLRECDAIIVVCNCPSCFYKNIIVRVEELRANYHKPIVVYDFHFLPNQGWYKIIKEKNPDNFGLERFDWYLLISIVTEFAIPREIPQIYSLVGMDVRSDNLKPQQKEFKVLLDFPRQNRNEERELVKSVLNELNIEYIELSGKYTTDQIREIYRSCDVYFPSVRESFGLPIVELQLCGCVVCVPSASWLPAHFVNKDPYVYGIGNLGKNFFCYGNRIGLKKILTELKESKINKDIIINNFKEEYPLYYSIDENALNDFINKIRTGEISENTHQSFNEYNSYICLDDDYSTK